MKNLNSRDVRRAKILEMASSGIPLAEIAEQNNCGITAVTNAINSPEGQERLQTVILECEKTINSELPELLELSMYHLKRILEKDKWGGASYMERIRASELVLKTAIQLSKLSASRN